MVIMVARVSVMILFLCLLIGTVSAQKRNVVLIVFDDLSTVIFDQPTLFANINGYENIRSLDNVWAVAPSCAPSRVSIMTGLHPYSANMVENKSYPLKSRLPNIITLPEYLSEYEINTIGYGKLFHSGDNKTVYWDVYESLFKIPTPEQVPNHGSTELFEHGAQQFDWGYVNQPSGAWGDHRIIDKGISFINSLDSTKRNSFLMLGLRFPHLPWYLPLGLRDSTLVNASGCENVNEVTGSLLLGDRYSFDLINNLNLGEEASKAYLNAVKYVDFQLNRFLKEFYRLGLQENTLLIITSDHGFHLGTMGRWRKKTLWQEALRVPFYVGIPENATDSLNNDSQVSLLDLHPTITDYFDIPNNPNCDGVSLFSSNRPGSNKDVWSVSVNYDLSNVADSFQYIMYNDGSSQRISLTSDGCSYENEKSPFSKDDFPFENLTERQIQTPDTIYYDFSVGNSTLSWENSSRQYFSCEIWKNDIQVALDSIVFDTSFSIELEPPFDFAIVAKNPIQSDCRRMASITDRSQTIYNTVLSNDQEILDVKEIYPNPSKGVVFVDINCLVGGLTLIEIFGLNGKKVMEKNCSLDEGHQTISFTIDFLDAGTYILVIGSKNFKLIVE